MKILIEKVEPELIENVILENADGEKDIYIKGIFAQADQKNKNGRVYPLSTMVRESIKLAKKIHSPQGLLMGLDHNDTTPVLNLKEACARMTSYKQDGKNFLGEAKVLKDTTHGRTLYGLLKEGIVVGVSTRALGSLREEDGANIVCDDLAIHGVDVVADPSAPDAWAESTLSEHSEFYMDEKGYIKEDVQATYQNRIKSLSKGELKEGVIKLFDTFLNEIK
jgi:hypothetical protein